MDRPYSIHHLKGGDITHLQALNCLFAEVFGDPSSYSAAPPGDAYLRQQLSSDQMIVLAAMQHQDVVGGLVAYVLSKLEHVRSEVYIYDLAVAADQRRRGIATELIKELKEIARDAGAWVIYVQADHGDDPAIWLYTKLGEHEDVLHFDIRVDKGKLSHYFLFIRYLLLLS